MAHFAEIENGTVIRVVVVHDNDAPTEDAGIAFLIGLYGPSTWKQTSYNTRANEHAQGGQSFRKNYAGIGYKYDEVLDAFIPPKPFPSWSLNTNKGVYEAPTPPPNNGKYTWDEEAQSWVAL